MEGLVMTLVVGALAGWLAGLIIKKGGFGLFGNIIVGIIGAVLGSYIFRALNISIGASEFVRDLITATVGAVVLLLAIGLIKR